MRCSYKLLFLFSITLASFVVSAKEESPPTTRKKRFIIFPKGTVIQLVYCYLMSVIGSEGIFTIGATLGTNWDVPVSLEKMIYDHKMSTMANRRDRRSLYPKIEFILNQIGVNGKNCIIKLLCQAQNRTLNPIQRYTFIEELIHVIFKYPTLPFDINEPIDEYDHILNECPQYGFVECR